MSDKTKKSINKPKIKHMRIIKAAEQRNVNNIISPGIKLSSIGAK
jgi:hypothetical protein